MKCIAAELWLSLARMDPDPASATAEEEKEREELGGKEDARPPTPSTRADRVSRAAQACKRCSQPFDVKPIVQPKCVTE